MNRNFQEQPKISRKVEVSFLKLSERRIRNPRICLRFEALLQNWVWLRAELSLCNSLA